METVGRGLVPLNTWRTMADIDWWARGVGAIGAGLGVWNLLTRRKQVRESEKEKDRYQRGAAALRELAKLTEDLIQMAGAYSPEGTPVEDSVASRRQLSGRMANRLSGLENGWHQHWRDTPEDVRKAYDLLQPGEHAGWYRQWQRDNYTMEMMRDRAAMIRGNAVQLLNVIERALA